MLSKREKWIAVVACAVLALLVTDWYVLTPLLEARDRVGIEHETKARELGEAAEALTQGRRSRAVWDEMVKGGLGVDPSDAESRMLNTLRAWSQETGLSISSIRPERVVKSNDLARIGFEATGNGTLRSVAQFMQRIESSSLPLRVHEMQVSSRSEGADDLTLRLRVSTICKDPDPPAKPVGTAGKPRAPARGGAS